MATWIVMILIMASGAVLQTLLPPVVFLGQVKLPFLLAGVLYYALNRETSVMLVAAFLGGFLQDIMSPIPLGYSVFSFCAIGLVAGRFQRLVLTETPMTPALFGAVGGVVATLGIFLLLAREDMVACSFWRLIMKLFGSAVLGAICTPIVFSVGMTLDRLAGNVELKESMDEVE